ncbi:O-phosphoseryl-tRNA(Sec) kinase, partial [Paragonimus westermani]
MPNLPRTSDENRVVLLLDDNFYYSSMRYTYFLLAKRYGLSFLSVACRCPLSVCLSRNSHRSKSVPDHIIIQMEQKIEWPNPQINRWEKHTVMLDYSSLLTPSHLQMILESITVAMQEPFSYAEETTRLERSDADREINAQSLIHGLDAVLRSTVGQMMAANDSEWKAKHSGLMSRLKSVVMNKMRAKIMKDHPKQSPEEYKEQTVSLF